MPKNKSSSPTTTKDLAKVINKKWPGAMKWADDPSLEVDRIGTGILSLDTRLAGGFPKGRSTEIYGGYSVGKTYITYRLIANAQKEGYNCAFVDAEGTFDPTFAESAGVDLKDLTFHQQEEHGNRCIDFMETLLRSGMYGVIVLDSIAALLPKPEAEQDIEKSQMGTAQAKLMSAALRKLTTANRDTIIVFINQTREAVGSMFKKNVTSGGRAMSFYASTRLDVARIENLKATVTTIDPKTGEATKSQQVVGHRVVVRVDKDKSGGARQHTQTTFVFDYRLGAIDHIEDLIYLGRLYGLIGKKDSWWWVRDYEEEKQNGRVKFKKWLRRNVAVTEELEERIWDEWGEDEGEVGEE